MANVAFLVPYPEMCDLVWSELGEGTGHITPVCVEYVPTPQVRGRVDRKSTRLNSSHMA